MSLRGIIGREQELVILQELYESSSPQFLPFTLAEARLFLEDQRVALPPQQFMELYMSVGGVAKYLTRCRPVGRPIS
jgi:hypothetical protein